MLRILYVDDETNLLDIGKLFLEESQEFSVDTALSAKDVLKSANLLKYDAIISDYQMPGMDGIAFLKEVRSRSGMIPFILFTGRGREEIVIEAINNGADFYLQKGGDPESQFAELVHKLRIAIERRATNRDLKESRETLSEIIAFFPDATMAIDAGRRVIIWNRALEEMSGIPASEMIGKGDYAYSVPFYGYARPQLMDLVLEPDHAIAEKYPVIHKEGDSLSIEVFCPALYGGKGAFVSTKATPLRDSAGQVIGAIESIRDITRQKTAEEEITYKNMILSTQQEISLHAILIVDKAGKILSYNQKFVSLWNIPGELIASQMDEPVLQYIVGQQADPEAFLSRVRYLYDHTDEKSFEELILSDGRILERYSAPMIGDAGKYYGRVWYFRDITGPRRAEQSLVESEEKYRMIVDTANEGIWAMDRNLRTTFVNQRMGDILGYSRKEMLDRAVDSFMIPDELPDHQEKLDERKQGKRGKYERRFLRRDGSIVWAEVSSTPILTKRGEFDGSFAMFSDITERKRAEEELRQKNEELHAAFEEITATEEELRSNLDELTLSQQTLREREQQLQLKLDRILSPGSEIRESEFANLIDSQEIQSMMDDFSSLTHMTVAVLDLKGNVIVASGWQDICTKFHRVNDQSCRNCTESDLYLTQNVKPGEYLTYRCKNNMRDMVTPIMIGGKQMGNLFIGQFFFKDEVPDRAVFVAQAEKFGFDRDEYLAALDRVPRWSRDKINTIMDFYTKFASMISRLSYSNVKLAKSLHDYEYAVKSHSESKEKFRQYMEYSPIGIFVVDRTGKYIEVNPTACSMLGYSREELLDLHFPDIAAPDQRILEIERFNKFLLRTGRMSIEGALQKKDRTIIAVQLDAIRLPDDTFMAFCSDITKRKRAEDALRESEEKYRIVIENANEAIIVAQDAYVKYANPKTLLLLQTTLERVLVRPFTDYIHHEDRDLVFDRYKHRLHGDEVPINYDFRVVGEQGLETWVQISAVRIDWQGKPATLSFLTNISKRKRAEEALRESERRLHALMQTIPDLVWLKDKDGIYLSCNTMFERFFGAKEPDIVGKIDYDFVDSKLAGFFRENDCRAMAAGTPTSNEEWITFADDGHRALLETIKTPMLDDQGTLIGIVGIGRDITGRKRVEEALRESEARFRGLVDTITSGVAIYDVHGDGASGRDYIIRSFNRMALEIEGKRLDEVVGKSLHDLRPAIDEFGLIPVFQRVWKTGVPEYYPQKIYVDGKYASWYENRVFRLQSGEIVAVYNDVTALMQAEEVLRESEERFRSLVTNIHDPILILGFDGTVRFANPAAFIFVGLSEGTGTEWKSIGKYLDPEYRNRAAADLEDIQKNGGPITSEYCIITRQGERRYVEACGVRIPYCGTESYLVTLRDITGRKLTEDALRQANRQLSLLSGITRHDIRNQLLALNSYLKLSRKTLGDAEKTSAFVHREEQVAKTIERQILFTKEYEDLGSSTPVWQNVGNCIKPALKGLNLTGIDLNIAGLGNIEILADTLLPKVFFNLADNALRHGGDAMAGIGISTHESDTGLVITFEDDGAGVVADDKEMIFERGYGKNTGYGLFLIREILSLTGITITETSEPGKGARFEISVPEGAWRFSGAER